MRMGMSTERRTARLARPGGRMSKAERKRLLLEHAKQLFLTHGYQDATTERIAAAAGVTEPVLYRHFESKKALFLEVLQDVRQATLLRFTEQAAKIADPLEKLRVVIDL